MSLSVMLDLETLATTPQSVVLTIGAVKFNPYTLDEPQPGLYLRLDVDEQTARGRLVDEGTVAWWGKQAEDVREEALSPDNRVSMNTLYQELNKFVVGAESIWAQGPVFDIAILEDIYRQYGWPIPWDFWRIRDSRTLFGVHGDPRVKGKAGLHNAMEDCISQAKAIQQIMNKLGIKQKA